MPKRPYPEDDVIQPIKKQLNGKRRFRNIRSSSAERSLQLLYEGAAKYESCSENIKERELCVGCSKLIFPAASCNYCEHNICCDCNKICYKCIKEFCPSCVFLTYDHNEAVCYACNTTK